MAAQATKRKTSGPLEEAVVSQSIDDKTYDDEEEDQSYRAHEDSSDNDDDVNTPVTPFSPASREKFPSERKRLQCTFPGCDKTFNRPIRLETHMNIHTNERTFKCSYEGCAKSYFEKKHLDAHIRGSHTKDKSYNCEWEGCGKSFLTNTRLKRHMETHKGNDRFVCTGYPGCNKAFRKHQTLQRHIRSDHLQLYPYPCTFVDPITGVPCGAGYEGATALKLHEKRVHATPFLCTECVIPGSFKPDGTPANLGFSTENQLNSHIERTHSNRKCCAFCEKKFNRKQDLHRHLEAQHSGKTVEERRTFKCQFTDCDKAYTKQYSLMLHIRASHEGERYICGTYDFSHIPNLAGFDKEDACGKDFATKANLENHIRSAHLGMSWQVIVPRKNQMRKRKRRSEVEEEDIDDDDESDCDEDQDYEMLDLEVGRIKKPKKKKGKKNNLSAIDELIGNSYANDPKRKIPCTVPGCPHKFIREYDRVFHMGTFHSENPSFNEEVDTTVFEQNMLSQEGCINDMNSAAIELETPLQQQDHWSMGLEQSFLNQSDNFWLGGGEFTPAHTPGGDFQWAHEEAEMRTLIDPASFASNGGFSNANDNEPVGSGQAVNFEGPIDPVLMGL
ncbi:hypothetical protein HYALB_00002574 [Hymenoscyphus albidus]|uniref:C2H2-type domain-containing protein n=1 Tax=Hymenoscyphus albidus TaxID=595503 RepID=A0A9N9LXV8_9HELO|nr:hypothetical protein HYALB_00002574 [Hymenoscyphus albidus]